MKNIERVLKALANRRRLAIVKYLSKTDRANVGEIADHIDLSFKATSKHLGVLSSVDIVDREQASLMMYYRLNKPSTLLKNILSLL